MPRKSLPQLAQQVSATEGPFSVIARSGSDKAGLTHICPRAIHLSDHVFVPLSISGFSLLGQRVAALASPL